MVEHARGVWALYRMPGGDTGYGCFVAREGEPVGAELYTTGLRALHDAVCVSLLDQNPSRAVAGMVDDYNAAHRMCTTENALVFGHRFDADLYTGYETGTMVVHRVSGGQRVQVALTLALAKQPQLATVGRTSGRFARVRRLLSVLKRLTAAPGRSPRDGAPKDRQALQHS